MYLHFPTISNEVLQKETCEEKKSVNKCDQCLYSFENKTKLRRYEQKCKWCFSQFATSKCKSMHKTPLTLLLKSLQFWLVKTIPLNIV